MKRIETLEAQLSGGVVVQEQKQVMPQVEIKKPEIKEHDVIAKPIQKVQTKVEDIVKTEPIVEQNSMQSVESDTHNTWVSILQSISSLTAKAYFQKAHPIELSENKIIIAFPNDMFIKMADKNKKQALADAITNYLGIKNPNIEIIVSSEIPKNVTTKPINPVIKNEPLVNTKEIKQDDIKEQEENEYQSFIESKQEQEKPQEKQIDTSSQANMVKDLFDGKFIE